jgi:hypothetical protein
VLVIYPATETFPHGERFGLASEIRRWSASIPADIARGSECNDADFFRYCNRAMSTAAVGTSCRVWRGPRLVGLRASMREGEAQVVLPRLEDDLMPWIQAMIAQRLHELPAPVDPHAVPDDPLPDQLLGQ